MSTPFHSKYYAHELTKRCSSDSLEKLSQSLNNATIDLNPHQSEATTAFVMKGQLPMIDDLEGFKSSSEADLVAINTQLGGCPHLSSFLKNNWAEAVTACIQKMGPDRKFDTAAFHLFRIFRDEAGLINRLEDGLSRIEPLARKAGKLTSYRETGRRLAFENLVQINQIESAIFEILVLRALITASSRSDVALELYPNLGAGKSNIEARVRIDRRWCNLEAKSLGWTPRALGADQARISWSSFGAMTAPITKSLEEKAACGRQLAIVPVGESAVVFLALKEGRNTRIFARAAAEDFLEKASSPLSAVIVFGSAFCRTQPEIIIGEQNSLTEPHRA